MKTKNYKYHIIILVLIIATCSCVQCKPDPIESGKLTFLLGSVHINGVAAKVGKRIMLGDTVITGEQSSAVIQFGNISLLSLKNNTRVTINKIFFQKRTIHILQETGKTFNKIRKNTDYMIVTPTLVAAVRGTSFALSIDKKTGNTRIGVMNGTVVVNRAKGAENARINIPADMEIAEGFGVDIAIDSPVVPRPLLREEKKELSGIESMEFIVDSSTGMKVDDAATPGSQTTQLQEGVSDTGAVSEKKEKTYDEILEEIKIRNKGKLDIIRLKNGRQIAGMIVERGLMFKIQTPRGMLSVTRDEIESQTISY